MKKLAYCIFPLLALAACKKENAVNRSSGTIVRYAGVKPGPNASSFITYNYSAQDSVTVMGLMSANSLPTNGFVFYAYQSYNALDQNNLMGFYQIASARQVRNGLPIFFEDITFGFENGHLNGAPPAPQFIAGNITLDNQPTVTLQTLRNAFIALDNTREAYNISIGDSTLVAQLGYYNLNVDQLAVGGAPNYIKAWFVHTQHLPWPGGYFRDDTGDAISFQPLTHSGPATP